MGKILKQLYFGELNPSPWKEGDGKAYESLCKRTVMELEEFTKKLEEERKEEFNHLMDLYLELTCMEKSQTFSNGFRLGAMMMLETTECGCQDGYMGEF